MNHTVEEVRAHAATLRDWRNGLDPNIGNDDAADMLNAYADTLSKPADSGRVTDISRLTRYLPSMPKHPGWQMNPDPSGEWVLFADVQALAAQGQPAKRIHPIATDDDVENLSALCGWNNRRYMTPADYSIWCQRMRKFVSLATQPAERVPDGWRRALQVLRDEDDFDAPASAERKAGWRAALDAVEQHMLAAAPQPGEPSAEDSRNG